MSVAGVRRSNGVIAASLLTLLVATRAHAEPGGMRLLRCRLNDFNTEHSVYAAVRAMRGC